jgi:glycosyltransferase involved in cell wall biosynthesis
MLDVLIVSLGSTGGLRAVDDELLAALRRAGARAEIARASPPRRMRTLVLTDLAWALAARRAASKALAREDARAVIYSTTTAALLWPRPGAIRFDALAAANRPGRHGLWQRPLERRRLREATLLLPQSEAALAEAPAAMLPQRDAALAEGPLAMPDRRTPPVAFDATGAVEGLRATGGVESWDATASAERLGAAVSVEGRLLVLPVPVEPSASPEELARAPRDIAAITYAANPAKKGLDVLLVAWARVRGPGEELWVTGVQEDDLRAQGYRLPAQGVRVTGSLPREEYRALLRRARAYVCAARREDYGIAQLEALADGCMLVTVPSPGAYAALPLARELDPRLVSQDIGAALRVALDDPAPAYAERAAGALRPFRREAVDALVSERLLSALIQ